MTMPLPGGPVGVDPKDDPNCTCKHYRQTETKDDGRIVPHWADLDKYCPSHGSKTAVAHDLETFPGALNSYACDPCQHGDHLNCQHEIRLPDWSAHCACEGIAQEAHTQVAHDAKRTAVADAIETTLTSSVFIHDIDGSTVLASQEIAEALMDKGLIR